MEPRQDGQNLERIFTLSEANQLIPQLQVHVRAIRRAREVLLQTKEEIRKASLRAQFGGGSFAGRHYINALKQISDHLRAIQQLGVLVKDLDTGLCDFPYEMEGRIVYLCWKYGEPEIRWWHDVDSGFSGRQPLDFETD
jgi:hypothetical protein